MMQEVAIVYGVIAWLFCWAIDLVVQLMTRPLFFDGLAKLIVVLACLIVVLMRTRAWMLW